MSLFHFVNFVIFWPQILWKCIDSGYLVSATLHTILYWSFWNFEHVFSMVGRCAYGLDIILKSIFIPSTKQSFRGVYCFQLVHNSIIPKFRQHLMILLKTLTAFVRFCSNLHHTITIRQCMFDIKIGAEGSVLQELCHFVILTINCLCYDW